jgi:hypothetical protein
MLDRVRVTPVSNPGTLTHATAAACTIGPPPLPSPVCVGAQVSLEEMTEEERSQAKQEVVLLASLRHPCIVAYHESFIQDGCLQ